MINLLLVTAFLLLGFHGSMAVFLASAVATACGAEIFYLLAAGRYQTRLTWFLAGSLLLGYGSGTVNTMLSFALSGYDGLLVVGIPKNYVAYAVQLVLLASAALLAAGHFEPPFICPRHLVRMSWKQERFLWIAVAFSALAYWHGDLSFEGSIVEAGTYRNSIFASLAAGMPGICLPLSAIGIVQARGRQRIRFILLGLLAALMLFPMGRRAVFYPLAIAIFAALRLSGWQPRFSAARKGMIAVSLLAVMGLSSFFFLSLRTSVNQSGSNHGVYRNGSLLAAAPILIENLLTNQSAMASQVGENMQSRTFIIGYLALLARGGDTPSPMMGSDAAFSVKIAIPDMVYSFFGIDKTPLRQINTEEGLANEHFGLPVYDDANSILTGGLIDFGLAGVIAYPLLLCLLFRGLLYVTKTLINIEGEIFAILFVLSALLQTEYELSAYVAGIRGLILMIFIWTLLYWLPDFFDSSCNSPRAAGWKGNWRASAAS